jgi:hypothetical protein
MKEADDGLFPGEREDGDSQIANPLFWAWSTFVSIAIAAHSFPDSEFYSDFKLLAGSAILLIAVLGSLVIAAALGHALFRAAIGRR